MKISVNGRIIEKADFRISLEDRAFRYGDGIFETILVKSGEPILLNFHIDRIRKGLDLLQIKSDWLDEAPIRDEIEKLLDSCQMKQNAKLRLTVWRKDGGLYTPSGHDHHYMISAHLLKNDYQVFGAINKVGFSKRTKNQSYELSGHKTLSAVRYVLAGIEKKENEWDDIIILHEDDYVSEGLHSNIFFIKNDHYLTPSLDTGCVNGVMRRFILEKLEEQNVRTDKVLFTTEDVMEAEQIFICNAMGVRFIKQIEDKEFDCQVPDILKKALEECT